MLCFNMALTGLPIWLDFYKIIPHFLPHFLFLLPHFLRRKRCQISLSMSARNLNMASFALPEDLAWKLGQPLGGSYEYPV
jgi:hypothetical protein